MSPLTTKSYGTIIYTNPGVDNKDKKPRRGGHRQRPSAYKRLNKDYPIDKHIFITAIEDAHNVRETMSLRVKNVVLDEMCADIEAGYIGKLGADVYVIKSSPGHCDIYLRAATRRKAYRKKIKSIRSFQNESQE